MQSKVQKFIDPSFVSLVDRMHGAMELLIAAREWDIVSVNVTADSYRFYGVIFYKWNGKESPWKD